MTMKPGLTRALPMALLGFIIGLAFVLLLRGLQSLDPLWDAQIGLIAATFSTAGFFIWGMGAFNPSVNQHAHEPDHDEYGLMVVDAEHDDHHEEEQEASTTQIFSASIWQITTWTTALVVLLFAFALLPTGFNLQQTSDPAAMPDNVGYTTWQVPFGGPEVMMSQLTLFIALIIFTIVSLGVIGGFIAWVFYSLSSGVTEAKASENIPLGTETRSAPALPAGDTGETAPAGAPAWLSDALRAVRFVIVTVVLYALFYYVLIGLVIPNAEATRIVLSAVNAVLFALVILHTTFVLRGVGRLSKWLARVLRGLPAGLGQK